MAKRKTMKKSPKVVDFDYDEDGDEFVNADVDEIDAKVEDANDGPKFKPGDVVRLKSGGPDMTVAVCHEYDGTVECTWFPQDDSGNYSRDAETATFAAAVLEIA